MTLFVVDPQINVVERAVFGISAELIDEDTVLRESEDVPRGQEGITTVVLVCVLSDRKKTVYFFHRAKSFLVLICEMIRRIAWKRFLMQESR